MKRNGLGTFRLMAGGKLSQSLSLLLLLLFKEAQVQGNMTIPRSATGLGILWGMDRQIKRKEKEKSSDHARASSQSIKRLRRDQRDISI